MKIVIVEDDLMIADILQDCLSQAGFEVCAVAHDSRSAVAQIRQHVPDIAIIDNHLGNGEHGTLIPALLPAMGPLGILFASGGPVEMADMPGFCTAAIQKPYSVEALTQALWIVADLLASGTTRRALPAGVTLAPAAAAP